MGCPAKVLPAMAVAGCVRLQAMAEIAAHQRYWQRTLRLTGALLALWFVVTFAIGFGARSLSFQFFGWPFNFWAAAQGALLVYVGIIAFYAYAMNKLDAAQPPPDDASAAAPGPG